MIPNNGNVLSDDFVIQERPTKTYQLDLTNNRINDTCDSLVAMKQAIYKILNTERFEWIIYSWNYGIETTDLFGQPDTYVCPELERRIEEALTQDTRIESVTDFDFDMSARGVIKASFIVRTIFGEINAEKDVNV